MAYIITSSTTFSSQANRDAALTRVNNALSGETYTNRATTLAAGVTTSGTTVLNISIEVSSDPGIAGTVGSAVLSALVASNRHTSGYVGVNKV